MQREEIKKIIGIMIASYSNYKPDNLALTVDVWNEMLSEYSYNDVAMALKTFIATDTSGFAPSIGQLIRTLNTLKTESVGGEMTEAEAWGIVSLAIRDSLYHSQERFEAFPETIKRAIGSPSNLRAYAMDENYNENVAQSNFLRSYRSVVERERNLQAVPVEVKQAIGIKTSNTERLMIEDV